MTKPTIDALVEALLASLEEDSDRATQGIFSNETQVLILEVRTAMAQDSTEHPEYFPTRPMVAQHSPSSVETAAAFNLGAGLQKVEATEPERRQFEAWMAGHNWQCAPWDGKQYTDVFTRTTWAAWRDRGALARAEPTTDADKRDAARYRHIRNRPDDEDSPFGEGPSPEELDWSVDEEMAEAAHNAKPEGVQ